MSLLPYFQKTSNFLTTDERGDVARKKARPFLFFVLYFFVFFLQYLCQDTLHTPQHVFSSTLLPNLPISCTIRFDIYNRKGPPHPLVQSVIMKYCMKPVTSPHFFNLVCSILTQRLIYLYIYVYILWKTALIPSYFNCYSIYIFSFTAGHNCNRCTTKNWNNFIGYSTTVLSTTSSFHGQHGYCLQAHLFQSCHIRLVCVCVWSFNKRPNWSTPLISYDSTGS